MVLRLTHLLGILLAVLTVSTQHALAQGDPGEVTRMAVQAMQRVTENTQHDLQAAATHGIAVIRQLDADGATDRQLILAAERAQHAIAAQATQGNRRVNMIAARAVSALHELDADRHFFLIVAEARATAHDAIQHAAERAHQAVRIALQEALDD
jgi:hypothetical protein